MGSLATAVTPTAIDSLGAILGLIIISIGGLVLLTLGVMMMIGAIMPKKTVITSWPAQQEQAFIPFDNRGGTSHAKAWGIAIPSGAAVFFIILIIYATVTPERHDISKTMNMSNLTKKDGATAPKAAPAPVPKQEAKPEAKPEEKKPDEAKEEVKKEEGKKEEVKKEEPKAEEKKPAEKPAEKPKAAPKKK
jgi:hypothetical protein